MRCHSEIPHIEGVTVLVSVVRGSVLRGGRVRKMCGDRGLYARCLACSVRMGDGNDMQ